MATIGLDKLYYATITENPDTGEETYAKPTQRVNSHWDYDLQQVVIDAPSNYDNGRTFDPVINQVFPIPVTAFNGTVNLTQNQGY